MDSLVSTTWLAQHLGEDGLVAVDASWHMPASGRSGHAEYLAAHIPGARFLDIDSLSDRQNPAPHMLPPAEEFARAMERLGIGSDDRLVVYDNSPIHTSARGWFMFRHFGAREVAILDGGLPKWVAEGRPTESGEPDPRPGVAAGHIPGARNLPFSALYAADGSFKSREEIERLFAEAGIDPARPFVASCGSGVTANSLIFAAHLLGNDGTRLYDGSWSEWGADPATPKASGPA